MHFFILRVQSRYSPRRVVAFRNLFDDLNLTYQTEGHVDNISVIMKATHDN